MKPDDKIIELAKKRGITTEEELEEFFSDKPKETYDPFLLPDMEAGVDIILTAIDDGKKICIYGDYDADGVTSTIILTEVLSELMDENMIIRYIPSRFDEGYGLNMKAIDKIKESGAGLIVTVDCGSVSKDEVAHAKELGLDVVITDHHRIGDTVSDAVLINPARKDSKYPFPYLAGCGVAFKLAQALSDAAGLDKSICTALLDLVAIGTIGDIVPLKSENRTLVKYGIRVINTSKRKALMTLIKTVGLRPGSISSEDISYVLVPHINAAGRMRSAGLALKLFLAGTEEEMEALAKELTEVNRERKRLQEDVYEKATAAAEADDVEKSILIEYVEGAHEGVAGIAAGKMKERYYKPSLIITDTDDGMLKGTGRSIRGVDLYDILRPENKMFEAFGGHEAACGFTMPKDYLSDFKNTVGKRVDAIKKERPSLFERKYEPDLKLKAKEATEELVQGIKMLEPFGRENEKPLVSVSGVPSGLTDMGKDGKYIRFMVADGVQVACVAFSCADEVRPIVVKAQAEGTQIMVMGSLDIHEWNGARTLQLNVKHAEA